MPDSVKLAEATAAAVTAENLTGAPAELLLAQWAIESGWGDRLAGNNCFGIKTYPGCYGRQLLRTVEWMTDSQAKDFLARGDGRTATVDPHSTFVTQEGRRKYICQDWFATFPTLALCFARRAQLFSTGRYKQFGDAYLQDRDLPKLVRGIAPIYATDPNYGSTLLKIIGQHNITTALAVARGPVNA